MIQHNRQNAIAFLQLLVGQPMCYAVKSPNLDLYDFGFGSTDRINAPARFMLHVVCRFKLFWKNESIQTDCFYEDTPCELFNKAIEKICGLHVKRIALSEKNDLWLDFGDYWMVFATFENREESWRFFTENRRDPHLVASDKWLRFDK